MNQEIIESVKYTLYCEPNINDKYVLFTITEFIDVVYHYNSKLLEVHNVFKYHENVSQYERYDINTLNDFIIQKENIIKNFKKYIEINKHLYELTGKLINNGVICIDNTVISVEYDCSIKIEHVTKNIYEFTKIYNKLTHNFDMIKSAKQ